MGREADVGVKFSATGEADVRDNINKIRDAVEGLKGQAEGLGDIFKEAAAAFGVAFSLDKIRDVIEGVAKLGEATERTADIFGIATQDVGLLAYAADLTGGNAESLVRSLERMSTSLTDVSGNITPTGAAVKALGLDIADLRGMGLMEILDTLRERFSQLPAGMERTAIAQNLVRNGAESLLPILRMNTGEWDNLRNNFEKTGAAMDERRAATFGALNDVFDTLGTSLNGLAQRFVEVLAPAISAATGVVTGFIQSLDAQDVADGLGVLVDTLLAVMTKITEIALEADRIMESVIIHAAAIGKYGVDAFSQAHVAEMAGLLADMNTRVDAQLAASKTMFKSWADTLKFYINQGMQTSPAAAGTGLAGGVGKPGAGKTFGSLDLGGAGANEATAAAKAAVEGQLQIVAAGYQRKKLLLDDDLAAGRINAQQYAQLSQQAADAEYNAQVDLYQKELLLGGLKLSQRQELLNKLSLLEQTHATNVLKIQQKAAEDTRKAWEAPINALGTAVSSEVGALVRGTESLGDAVLNIGASLATDLIQSAIKAITALAAQAFAGTFANLAPALGPAAAGPAAGVQAAVLAAGAALPSLAVGTWGLPSDGAIYAHRGETVMPRFESEQFRGMVDAVNNGFGALGGAAQGGAGGGDTHIHLHGAFNDAAAIAKAVANQFDRNPSLRPKN